MFLPLFLSTNKYPEDRSHPFTKAKDLDDMLKLIRTEYVDWDSLLKNNENNKENNEKEK